MSDRNFDDLLVQLGTGRWNLVLFITVGYWTMNLAPNALGGRFMTPEVEYTCNPPDDAFTVTSVTYNSDGTRVSTTDNCNYLAHRKNDSMLQQEPCNSWHYDNSTYSSTLTSQFDLVCSFQYLQATFDSIYTYGCLLGAPINGFLSDRFGRKTVLTVGVIVYFSFGIGTCWLPTFSVILVFRFVLGLFHSSIFHTGFVLALEACEPRHRSLVGIGLGLPWAVGAVGVGGLAFLLRDWHWLHLALSLPGLLLFPALWFLDESPRWLIVKGHMDQARKVLEKAALWNKVELPPSQELDRLMNTIHKESSRGGQAAPEEDSEEGATEEAITSHTIRGCHSSPPSFLSLFRTPKLRLITLVLWSCHFAAAVAAYGTSPPGGRSSYAAGPFADAALVGLMEVPGCTVAALVVGRVGRKWPALFCHAFGGAVLLALPYVPTGIRWVATALGSAVSGASRRVLLLLGAELLPTEVRLRGVASAAAAYGVASVASPLVEGLLLPLYTAAPSLVFGLSSLAAGAACLLLPDTHNASLPDTIAHLHHTPRHHRPPPRPEAEAEEEVEMAKLRA